MIVSNDFFIKLNLLTQDAFGNAVRSTLVLAMKERVKNAPKAFKTEETFHVNCLVKIPKPI
jgi:hypothetical protein